MLVLSLAGNLGRDAEYKTTQSSELCSFPVGVSIGYGDNKSTVWVDCTKWGKGAEGLARILRKGSKVAVSGEMSLHENNGKTYVKCRANDVTIMGTPQGDGSRGAPSQISAGGGSGDGHGYGTDDDGEVPFITNTGIY